MVNTLYILCAKEMKGKESEEDRVIKWLDKVECL